MLRAGAAGRPFTALGGAWRPTVGAHGPADARGGSVPPRAALGVPAAAATAYVFAWAIIEAPALLGIVGYLLGGSATLLLAALLTAAIGFAVTAPTRETFGLR